jgi:hypothetical protein
MLKEIEVTITVEGRELHLKGPEDFVREVVHHLAASMVPSSVPDAARPVVATIPAGAPSEEALVAEKRPANHAEYVAVMAYALKASGYTEFSEDDMTRAYKRARVRPPKVVGQAIRDAKNQFDYIEAGSGRGLYRLSHHGERTVEFDMPREKQES